MSKRKYTKRRRAQQEADTRHRIVTAAAALHGEKGPRDTTVSAIAARAGVQRLTVYRHFPDDHALFEACTAHWLDANPPPAPSDWRDQADPEQRTRTALAALYTYYRRTSEMWRLVHRDRDDVPALQAPMRGFEQYLDGIRDHLVSSWSPGRRQARVVRAILGHYLKYPTWRSLDQEGLSDEEMADLAVRCLCCLALASTSRYGTATGARRGGG